MVVKLAGGAFNAAGRDGIHDQGHTQENEIDTDVKADDPRGGRRPTPQNEVSQSKVDDTAQQHPTPMAQVAAELNGLKVF